MAKTKKRPRDGYWFRCIRKAFNLSQYEVAYTAGISNVTVSNYETGRACVDQEIVNAMHWALITLVHRCEKIYGEKRSKTLIDIAKLDFCQYFDEYDCFVIGIWSTNTDKATIDEALVWNGIVKGGDIV